MNCLSDCKSSLQLLVHVVILVWLYICTCHKNTTIWELGIFCSDVHGLVTLKSIAWVGSSVQFSSARGMLGICATFWFFSSAGNRCQNCIIRRSGRGSWRTSSLVIRLVRLWQMTVLCELYNCCKNCLYLWSWCRSVLQKSITRRLPPPHFLSFHTAK